MHDLPDLHERQRALDITRSFLVQAPAGSGKTELLTQRFLKLLSCVDVPEEIIAITFTKKAAAEMRSRVLMTLNQAKTDIAKQALQHLQKKQWNLQEYPNRLRILTLDALSLHIAKQLPISSKLGAQLNITEDATTLYQHAVKKILLDPPKNSPWLEDIKTLFLHLDNNYDRIEELFIELLAKREQWLPLVISQHKNADYRQYLENELQHINEFSLKKEHILPEKIKNELLALSDYAKSHLDNSHKNLSRKEHWLFIADMLLTKDNSLRKRADKNIGFPSSSSSKNTNEKKIYEQYKQRYQAFIQTLEQQSTFTDWLIELRHLPNTQYTESQWQVLSALLTLLPLTAAQLRLIFTQYNQIDYIENAQSALQALGSPDQPTDLSLRLDYKIQHLLVDEFQDTSNNQFQLLEKLTAGWTPGDGRTLFLVGDPMQSIYRFRQAEVGLFLHAKHHGLGNISLEFLALTSNFRSTPSLVTWINHIFNTVFPQQENMPLGAIPYNCANAALDMTEDTITSPAECFYFSEENTLQEERYIVETIKTLQKNASRDSIAILIRSREQIKSITPLLQAENIDYQAVDIEPLSHKAMIYDAMSLTRAYVHLDDRTAWLACLRAPWCGLSLHDLWIIAHDDARTIWQQLNDQSVIASLSDDGKFRIAYFNQAMNFAIQQRQRFSLRDIIEKVWQRLHASHAYPLEKSSDNLQQFFKVLDTIVDHHGMIQLSLLERKIQKLFAVTPATHTNPVQIMTIHKSKGLEFDHVFIPKLHKKEPPQDKNLLTWLEYPDDDNIYHLLMAPLSESNTQDNTYDYIQQQQQKKLFFELDRLLYVAITRAKKKVYLTATVANNEKSSNARGLFARLMTHHPTLFEEAKLIDAVTTTLLKEEKNIQRFTQKTLNSFISPENNNIEYLSHQENLPHLYYPSISIEAKIGILIHQLIEQISQQGIVWWQNLSLDLQQKCITLLCAQTNLTNDAASKIHQAISSMLKDPRGQWILQAHRATWSEYVIRHHNGTTWETRILDRVILDENDTYWIIDYKTTQDISQAITEHRPQLYKYYQALCTLVASKNIRAALYFPILGVWQEVSFS